VPLTSDGKAKTRPAVSESGDRVAYLEQCALNEDCNPRLIIMDAEGRAVQRITLEREYALFGNVYLRWRSARAVEMRSHVNPSLDTFIEVDLSAGKITKNLMGFDFTRSPNGKLVAHVGWIIHFAPPFEQSYYLQVDRTTIYPLVAGQKPVAEKEMKGSPAVVRKRGLSYSGIHQFQSGLVWSPDSRRIALVDCTYTWTERQEGSPGGDESNRLCKVAVVSLDGKVTLFPLNGSAASASLTWKGSRRLMIEDDKGSRTVVVP
jgi:hypothetical protein